MAYLSPSMVDQSFRINRWPEQDRAQYHKDVQERMDIMSMNAYERQIWYAGLDPVAYARTGMHPQPPKKKENTTSMFVATHQAAPGGYRAVLKNSHGTLAWESPEVYEDLNDAIQAAQAAVVAVEKATLEAAGLKTAAQKRVPKKVTAQQ